MGRGDALVTLPAGRKRWSSHWPAWGAGRRAIGGWERGRELAPSVIRNTDFTLLKFKTHIRFATMAEQVYVDTHSIKLKLSICV